MDHLPLINQAKEYVTTYLHEHQNPNLIYHNFLHTENVVAAARQMSSYYELGNNDLLITLTAALFIDTGYYEDYGQHEEAAARIAENFLKKAGMGEEIKRAVKSCILATKPPQNPHTLPEQIVCDATLFYLGGVDFGEQSKGLRKELSLTQAMPVDKVAWRKGMIQFMEGHSYHTDYCKKHLAKKKKDNLESLKKKDRETAPPVDPVTALWQKAPAPVDAPGVKEEKKKEERPERTIETMFRVTLDKSQRLSDQADAKSHIMISVNSLIITIVLSVLAPKVGQNSIPEFMFIPVMILVTVSMLTIIFSVLAARPHVPAGTFTQQEMEEQKVNLLFFGNFYKMDVEVYNSAMFKVMDDKHFLYLNLLRDIYTQGVRLGEKYRMLKISYNIFMYGMVISIIAFVVASQFL
ncbi:MAG TPA: Pycsar system effector family protein [Chitinophagaceae bacterium]|jgi:predicted metal-dependent HD superfamily phosphohydrolase|nr:Pycsar system effector family protein [Chitinophagaceae bacterium]